MRRHHRAVAEVSKDTHHGRSRGLIWSGAVSFGLVMSPIGYRKVNKNTGQEVPHGQIVKGFKYGEDEYVTLTDEDFKRASPERTQRIDIAAFVDAKAKAGKTHPAPAAPAKSAPLPQSVDIMSLLKKSIAKGQALHHAR